MESRLSAPWMQHALRGKRFVLPLAVVWWRRGLETAVGFHFCMDFVMWVFALVVGAGGG